MPIWSQLSVIGSELSKFSSNALFITTISLQRAAVLVTWWQWFAQIVQGVGRLYPQGHHVELWLLPPWLEGLAKIQSCAQWIGHIPGLFSVVKCVFFLPVKMSGESQFKTHLRLRLQLF